MYSIRSHWSYHHAGILGEFHLCASWCSPRAMPKLLGHGKSHGHVASYPTWLCSTTHVAASRQKQCISHVFAPPVLMHADVN